jgi:hypothetical protein
MIADLGHRSRRKTIGTVLFMECTPSFFINISRVGEEVGGGSQVSNPCSVGALAKHFSEGFPVKLKRGIFWQEA